MPGSIGKPTGFSLIEVMVVVGILTIVALIAIPNMIDWRHGLRLRAAVNEIRGDLEAARARAIKENASVSVEFFPVQGRYQLTYTDAAGSNVLIKDQSLPPGIRLPAENPFGGSGNKTSFTSRGTATGGTLIVENEKGKSRSIVVNFLGRIDVRD